MHPAISAERASPRPSGWLPGFFWVCPDGDAPGSRPNPEPHYGSKQMATAVATRDGADSGALSREQLDERAVYRRAVEAVIWGMPAVNYDRMLQSFAAAGGGPNQ